MAGVVEFCCGYGGATAGMLAAGLDIEASYDLWPVAVEQHRAWHPDVPCEVRDVSTVTSDELAGRFVWASLPCQPWSTANRYPDRRGKNHPHYYSLAHFARQVQDARCAIIENVPGLVHTKDGQAELRELERECNRLGLTMTVHLVYSHWFSVQQQRRRAFIVIGRNLPLVLIQPGSGMTGSLRRKLERAPVATEGKGGPGHGLARSVTCNPAGENIHSSKRQKLGRAVNTRRGGVPTLERSVTAGRREGSGGGSWQPVGTEGQTRSIAEVAALQGVPVPDASLSKTAAYTLIGNCVPPKLARAIAEQVFLPFFKRRAAV